MKIALITLHRIVNYGSVLQTYATQFILEKMGHTVEVVDYCDERMTLMGMLRRIKTKRIALSKPIVCQIAQLVMLPSYIKRFYIFWSFLKKNIHLTKKKYSSFEQLQKDTPVADCYCTGSDQVWNSVWNEKVDKVFFLDFIPDGKPCFAYAASFGKNELDLREIDITKNLLKKYGLLSCRELQGTKILKELGYDSECVLDPTLLLNQEDWETLVSKRFENKKYIFVYNLNRSKEIDVAAKILSKELNIPVYTVSYCYHEIPSRQGKVFVNPCIEDFLSLIANACYVLTDSFHATAFSINFSRQVFVYYPDQFSSRLTSIVEMAGIQHHIAKNKNILELIQQPIDYSCVHLMLNPVRNKSLLFLEKALKYAKQTAHSN